MSSREPKAKTFILRMSDSEYLRLKKLADLDNVFMAEYVRKLINKQSQQNNGKKGSSNAG